MSQCLGWTGKLLSCLGGGLGLGVAEVLAAGGAERSRRPLLTLFCTVLKVPGRTGRAHGAGVELVAGVLLPWDYLPALPAPDMELNGLRGSLGTTCAGE